jgi:hypothetical protein
VEKRECLVWKMSSLVVLFWFLFFMMPCEIKVPIGWIGLRKDDEVLLFEGDWCLQDNRKS